MKRFKGKAAYKGIALGSIHVLKRQQREIKREVITDTKN